MNQVLNAREIEFLQASIFHCKSQYNMGKTPDPVIARFVVDMAQRMLDQPVTHREVPPSRYIVREKERKSEDALPI